MKITTTAQRLEALGCPYEIDQNGRLWPVAKWAWENLVIIPLPKPLPPYLGATKLVRSFRFHRLLEAQIRGVLEDLLASHGWDFFSTYSGSFNIRLQRGSKTAVSAHSFGCAVDFNAEMMPMGSDKAWPAKVIKVWNEHGFINGAGWARRDPMHCEARKVFP